MEIMREIFQELYLDIAHLFFLYFIDQKLINKVTFNYQEAQKFHLAVYLKKGKKPSTFQDKIETKYLYYILLIIYEESICNM